MIHHDPFTLLTVAPLAILAIGGGVLGVIGTIGRHLDRRATVDQATVTRPTRYRGTHRPQ